VTSPISTLLQKEATKDTHKSSPPLGVLVIADFYVFGALVLLVTLFLNPEQTSQFIAERHGQPADTGVWILPVLAIFSLVLACGLFSLSPWGFFLAII